MLKSATSSWHSVVTFFIRAVSEKLSSSLGILSPAAEILPWGWG